MYARRMEYITGCSSIEVETVVISISSWGHFTSSVPTNYSFLDEIEKELQAHGYEADTTSLNAIDDEEKECSEIPK